MADSPTQPNSGRKLFFGLFVFPLLIAVGMAVLLCAVVLMTHESETPESLLTAIKTGSPSKRWQKAFELSNELNRKKGILRDQSLMREMIHILGDPVHYDPKTRGYVALALTHFDETEAKTALRKALRDTDSATGGEEVQLYALWALGTLRVREAEGEARELLSHEKDDLRKMAAYVLGVLGSSDSIPTLRAHLDDPAADVRWNAALALARLGDDAGVSELLKMLERQRLASRNDLSEDQIEAIMINAAKGLGLVGGPGARETLVAVSKNDKSLKVRQAALEAIRRQEAA